MNKKLMLFLLFLSLFGASGAYGASGFTTEVVRAGGVSTDELKSPGMRTGRSISLYKEEDFEPKRKFKSTQHVIVWIYDYQKNPQPEYVPDAIHALADFGVFEDLDQAGLYIGFLAGVLGDNQLMARRLIKRLFPMTPKNQAVIIMAIAYSGLPEWRLVLTDFTERMPARTVLIDEFLFGSHKPLLEAPIDQNPHMIDALWGYYIATGYLQPVERVIATLSWIQATDNTDRFTLAHMAMWTLVKNAELDRPLLRFYRRLLPSASKEIKAPLQKVIKASERFESNKIKKAVIIAIATQKRRKLGKTTKWAWGAKAGEALLAVGCVTASALGHPELAAPCIVTGAIYKGVRKLMFDKTSP
ncbi:MAG: hypothetical protein GY927_05630 [bacterium]|nr:hypothetical protein [bacterium]